MGLNYYQIKKKILRARKLVIKATNIAGPGHPGGSLSLAELLGCLFYKYLKFDTNNPQWDDRDRLVLSKGHAAPGLCSNMAVAGYFPESELETLRKFGSKLQGHPDLKCPGVEFCGGSLGTGLSYSIGVALAAKINSKAYRAVGGVLRNNPLPLIIPCHRVIKQDGKLGGFMGKMDKDWQTNLKRSLLKIEGNVISD